MSTQKIKLFYISLSSFIFISIGITIDNYVNKKHNITVINFEFKAKKIPNYEWLEKGATPFELPWVSADALCKRIEAARFAPLFNKNLDHSKNKRYTIRPNCIDSVGFTVEVPESEVQEHIKIIKNNISELPSELGINNLIEENKKYLRSLKIQMSGIKFEQDFENVLTMQKIKICKELRISEDSCSGNLDIISSTLKQKYKRYQMLQDSFNADFLENYFDVAYSIGSGKISKENRIRQKVSLIIIFSALGAFVGLVVPIIIKKNYY